MKNIKSLLLVTAGVFASTCIQAQDMKASVAKPLENTVPAPGSKPVPAPDSKPIENRKFQVSNEKVVTETPSPSKRDETNNLPGDKGATGTLTADQMKTLSGTAERPKAQTTIVDDKNAKPLPTTIPVILKAQENK